MKVGGTDDVTGPLGPIGERRSNADAVTYMGVSRLYSLHLVICPGPRQARARPAPATHTAALARHRG